MNNYANFLLEKTEFKKIYHFTESDESLISILKGDSLESGIFNNAYGRGYENISFTWNPKMWDIEYVGDLYPRYQARISFNYDKMCKKWDFKKFDYGIKEEEEIIIEEQEIFGVSEYITEILISDEVSMDNIKHIRRMFPSINIKIVRRDK